MTEDATTTPAADDLEAEVVAVSDGAYALIVADFNDIDAAWEAYELLKSVEDGQRLEIESVVVVKCDADGKIEVQKATDHSTRRGLGWGVVGGVVLGVIFPPSIIASAAVLGAGGAAIGKARELHHRTELADELAGALDPGSLGHHRPGLGSGRGRDPQGARQGQPRRRARGRQGRRGRHQGGRQGGRG